MAAQTISFEPPRQKQMDLEMISINMFTKSFSFPAAHNQKKVIISNEYIKTIIGSIGLDYLIQKLLYLNEHHFNIRPAVDEKQNYYYNLVLPKYWCFDILWRIRIVKKFFEFAAEAFILYCLTMFYFTLLIAALILKPFYLIYLLITKKRI